LKLLRILLAIIFIAFLFLPVMPVQAFGKTYYVSTKGNDSGAGTIGSPWRTIDHAVNNVVPGDTILVRGGTYNEAVSITISGIAGQVCTLRAYPGEAVTITKSSGSLTTGIIYLPNVEYWTIDGFEITAGANQLDIKYGIYIRETRGANKSTHITMQNLIIHDVASSAIMCNPLHVADHVMTNITIDNVEVYNTNDDRDHEAISLIGVDTFEIKNCHVHNVHKEGIDVKQGSCNGSIHDNELTATDSNTAVGIYVDGFHYKAHDIDIYNNYCHDWSSTAIGVGAESGGSSSDINIYNNIVTGAWNGIALIDYGSDPKTNINLLNNTIYDCRNGIWCEAGGNYNTCVIRNNLIYATAKASVHSIDCEDSADFSIDHNLHYDGNGDHSWISGQDAGVDVINADPLFINPGSSNFRLQTNSPARNAGSLTLAPGTDFKGNSRGANIDIGAYEYTDSSEINPPTNVPATVPTTPAPASPATTPAPTPANSGRQSSYIFLRTIVPIGLILAGIKGALKTGRASFLVIALISAAFVYLLFNLYTNSNLWICYLMVGPR
jgi:hypothetical protein